MLDEDLPHSIAGNLALVDGNKRHAMAAVVAFDAINGLRLTLSNDAAYGLLMGVAGGRLSTVAQIAAVLIEGTGQRR